MGDVLSSRRARRFVIGDPQASAATFFDILDRHRLLGRAGRLADDAALVSVGDHFDFGATGEREEAAASGLEILRWLASHPSDQVVVIAGNHDLARVGELADFGDADFARAHREAKDAYHDGETDAQAEAALLTRFPALPSAELAARDFAAFSVAQREFIKELLGAKRLKLAVALDACTLVCHAGVTIDQLQASGLAESQWTDAMAIADHLNDCLDRAGGGAGPLEIPGLHQPGSASSGEGVGMLYHRPANPALDVNVEHSFHGALTRRFDPRRLVPGITQIVGHISDSKCRQLLGPWAHAQAAAPGELRHLIVEDEEVRYAAGLPAPSTVARTAMIFVDGGMSRIPTTSYQLLDVASYDSV